MAATHIKIFVDLDGVLVDFEKKLSELLGRPIKKDEDFGNDSKIWAKISRAGIKFWNSMEWMPDGHDLWDYIKKYKPTILSSPTNHPSSVEGKKEWLKENLPKVPYIIEHNKTQYAKSNAILIDDREKNIKKWEEAGGIGILHKSAKGSIKKIEKIMEKEKEASVDYAGKVKTASVMEVINGYLSKIAAGASIMDAPSPAQSKWEQFLKSQGRGEGTPTEQRPSLGNCVQRTINPVMQATQDLMSNPKFKNIKAKEVWGKIQRLREMNPAVSVEEEKKDIQDSMIQIGSGDIIELFGYILKDKKSWKEDKAAMELISRIKSNTGITPDAPKATDIFKTPTEIVRPKIQGPMTDEERRRSNIRLRELAKQRGLLSKEAAEQIDRLIDRLEAIMKEAGLI